MTSAIDRAAEGAGSSEVAALTAAWLRGERVSAAELLARSPGIGDEGAIRLIYEETCLRREAGLEADTSEVVRRHPRWADDLRALFECDRLLRPSGAAPFPEIGEALGPFRLVVELGRGASGRTYLATDPSLAERPVVLKVISTGAEEHLALAQLRHTHIVPLFSEHDFAERGLRGLCMPYLGGASLAHVLAQLGETPPERRSGRLMLRAIDAGTRPVGTPPAADGPFRRSLEGSCYTRAVTWIAACLADALQYAHARGIVHMDLKPSNVLVTADGQPMLLDFHLARAPIAAGEPIGGRLGGTPGWMSPEQEAALAAAREGRPAPTGVDGRSDIYALGLLLREALAPGPGRWVPGVGVALADVVRKCLEPDPRDRYPDAAALAEDLRRELGDLPLRGVRNRSVRERIGKWRRRHPGARAWGFAAAAGVLGLAVALAAGATVYRQRVGQLEAALEEGRKHRLAGRWDEAIRVLDQARPDAAGVPFVGGLRQGLGEELRLARRGRAADELHRLADVIRARYGVAPPSPAEAGPLDDLCRRVWARRGELLAGAQALPRASGDRIRADLLEIAAIGVELRLRPGPMADAEPARREALRVLDEAERALGPSFLIDLRRSEVAGEPGGDAASAEGASRPESAWEYYELGRHHLRTGRVAEARAAFRRAPERGPGDFWSHFYEGLCAYRLGDHGESAAAFRACLALRPASAPCYYNRALALAAMGRGDEARADCTRALELDPGLTTARLQRGTSAYQDGRYAEAAADFEAGIQAHPDRAMLAQPRYNLALVRLATGDRAAARDEADRAARLGSSGAMSLLDELQ